MAKKIAEDDVELMAIELLEEQGYTYFFGPDIAPEGPEPERLNYKDVLLRSRLRNKLIEFNPDLPTSAIEEAFKQVCSLSGPELLAANEKLHSFITNGIDVEYQVDSDVRGDKVWITDFENIENNDFVVCNQFTIIEGPKQKRPDIILFINGLPLVVMELQSPTDKFATVKKAFNRLQSYKNTIPTLFHYNGLLVASDGRDARVGLLSADFSRFMQWNTKDGLSEVSGRYPQLETLIQGILNPRALLDLIRFFTVFIKEKKEDKETGRISIKTAKIIAAYHQFYAVKKAVSSVMTASKNGGTGKGGVVWHTQGSGKSFSMVFFAGMLRQKLNNPTVMVITDRNDPDDQLFDTFAASRQLLRQDPFQIESRDEIRSELKSVAGGIIFSTVQKFTPQEGEAIYPQLSDRQDIVVIADEAHRAQYGFRATTIYVKDADGNYLDTKTAYGFAKYMRNALPNATFLGFAETPVESKDVNTAAVFGNYIDIYDIEQAIGDGATVPVYYESRLAKTHLNKVAIEIIDEETDEISDRPSINTPENSQSKWSNIAAIVGSPERLKSVARDIIKHFEKRCSVMNGKGMIVAMSRKNAVELYQFITEFKPGWHDDNYKKGAIKIIMTSSFSDPQNWQWHSTTRKQRRELGDRLKDPDDPLKLVIVRDMWLTGIDAPCLHTLYVDKPMKGHNLMQVIAWVNRPYKDKPGGLVVDYIGIAGNLKKIQDTYTESGGKGTPTNNLGDAFLILKEKIEMVSRLLNGSSSDLYYIAGTRDRLRIILEVQEHVLGLEDGKNRFIQQVSTLSKAYALCSTMKEVEPYRDEITFYQAIKARLAKFDSRGSEKPDEELETAIRQIIDKALVSDGFGDIFDAAGIKKPDTAILTDDFLEEVRNIKHKNIAIELLRNLLKNEIRIRFKKQSNQSRKLSEMLEISIRRYQNKLLTATEVIQELIYIAKDIRAQDKRRESLDLTAVEYAFYSAPEVNDSANRIPVNQLSRDISIALAEKVRNNITTDWEIKEDVRAKLRVLIERILRQYGYPSDLEKIAVDRILRQTELSADSWDAKLTAEISNEPTDHTENEAKPCKDMADVKESSGSREIPEVSIETLIPESSISEDFKDNSIKLSELEGFNYLEQAHQDLVKWLHSQKKFSLEIFREHGELENFGPPVISAAGNFVIYDQKELNESDELPPETLADGTKVITVDFTETVNGNIPENILIAMKGGPG